MTTRTPRLAAVNSGYSSGQQRSGAIEGYSTFTSNSLSPLSVKVLPLHDFGTNNTSNKRVRKNTLTYGNEGLILNIPEVCLHRAFSYFVSDIAVDVDSFNHIQCVSKLFKKIINSGAMWYNIPIIKHDGHMNLNVFKYLKKKSQGTEGTCYHVFNRCYQKEYALKRARVYPDNEGVPYYMMRELSALKKINHPNICELELICLHEFKLYLLFPYIEQTLHDYINPSGEPNSGIPLKKHQVHSFTRQLLEAVAHIHRRGIMHRNLKPKHLLVVPGPGPDPLDGAQIKLADFALVRILGHPPKKFTTEVITLWYRPPEILMGQKDYSASVDIWSLGCIFAEMLQGRPLFTGLCEIDQLFQIFFKMGTPNIDTWPAFVSMPHYQESIFPMWQACQLKAQVSNADELEQDLLNRCLRFEPMERLSAEEALRHRCLDVSRLASFPPTSDGGDIGFLGIDAGGGGNSVGCVGGTTFGTELAASQGVDEDMYDSIGFNNSVDSHFSTASLVVIEGGTGGGGGGTSASSSGGQQQQCISPVSPRLLNRPADSKVMCPKVPPPPSDLILDADDEDRRYAHPALVKLHKTTLRQYRFLRQLELQIHFPSHSYWLSEHSKRQLVTLPSMDAGDEEHSSNRARLVDWLLDVLDVFDYHMCLRTAYFAIALVDRFLSLCMSSPGVAKGCVGILGGVTAAGESEESALRLLGSTCLHIASKCEDVSYIGIRDLASQTGDTATYEPRDILTMEELVLNRLGFDVYLPTVIDFICLFLESVPELHADLGVQCCTKYLGELSLLYEEFTIFPPSLIAASAVCLALYLSDTTSNVWPETVEALSGYKLSELERCVRALQKVHKDAPVAPVFVVYSRYSRASNSEVAKWNSKPLPYPPHFLMRS